MRVRKFAEVSPTALRAVANHLRRFADLRPIAKPSRAAFARLSLDPDPISPLCGLTAMACCLDLAPVAWELYQKWKAHQGFIGTRIRSITRDNGEIVEVPDGVIFPILAAHSAFVKQGKKSDWKLNMPAGAKRR